MHSTELCLMAKALRNNLHAGSTYNVRLILVIASSDNRPLQHAGANIRTIEIFDYVRSQIIKHFYTNVTIST
jgi:hypothetical protein